MNLCVWFVIQWSFLARDDLTIPDDTINTWTSDDGRNCIVSSALYRQSLGLNRSVMMMMPVSHLDISNSCCLTNNLYSRFDRKQFWCGPSSAAAITAIICACCEQYNQGSIEFWIFDLTPIMLLQSVHCAASESGVLCRSCAFFSHLVYIKQICPNRKSGKR